MKSSHVVALMVILALVPSSLAVICSSFTNPDSCNGTYTDTGMCAWNATTSTCFLTDVPLPPGKVGITAIPSLDEGQGPPPLIIDPPRPTQEPQTIDPTDRSPPPETEVTPDIYPPIPKPTTPVIIPQWTKVNLNNTQVVDPITKEVQKLLTNTQSTATPLCIYTRDPDVWAVYATNDNGQQQNGYVLASTSCSVSMTVGEDKEQTSCSYYLMDFDGSSGSSGQSTPGFAGTASSGTAGGSGEATAVESILTPSSEIAPGESVGVVAMSVEPGSTTSTAQYSLITKSAANELCAAGPTKEEPAIGGNDILEIEPASGVEKNEEGEASSSSTSSGVMVVVGRSLMMMMMVAGMV